MYMEVHHLQDLIVQDLQVMYMVRCGVSLARTSYAQANQGTAVDKSNLQPGDLLLFTTNGANGGISHVGVYVGNGQFIHAANPSRGVVYDTINSGYYSTNYAGARRVN